MRVAVHIPEGHPAHGGGVEGHAVVAYRLGRIEDGVHNVTLHTGEATPLDEFVGGLVEQAKREYPDCEVVVERLVDNGDGTGRWISQDEFDQAEHAPVGAGEQRATEIHVDASQQAGG